MDVATRYNRLFADAKEKMAAGKLCAVPQLDAAADKRMGLTLRIRPPKPVLDKLADFIDELKAIEPGQYYYDPENLHITFLTIFTGSTGFDHNELEIKKYIDLIGHSLIKHKRTSINLTGITATNSAIMAQGFMENHLINTIRHKLRVAFKASGLKNTIDKRYTLQTAHSTIARFRQDFINVEGFLHKLESSRKRCFGKFSVDRLELVSNNWYHHPNSLKILHVFPLK